MKPTLLLAVFLHVAASAHAQTVQDDVAALEKKRVAEVARATDAINHNYPKEYEKLLQRANLVGDAQGANLVRAAIRKFNPEPEATPAEVKAPSADPATTVLTSNHWADEVTLLNGHHQLYPRVFLPNGHMTSTTPDQSGTWKIENNALVVEISAHPTWTSRFPLPMQREKWRGMEASGIAHDLTVDKTGGSVTPASSASPAATPARSSDYFGRPGL